MFRSRRKYSFGLSDDGGLYDQNTFYKRFINDLRSARKEVIIESPFITSNRMNIILPALKRLRRRGVRIVINTKPLEEHDPFLQLQAEEAIEAMQTIGVEVLFTVGHHRKLAIIDKSIVWEGSLNILSQYDSCEIMRRLQSEELADRLINFIKLNRFLA